MGRSGNIDRDGFRGRLAQQRKSAQREDNKDQDSSAHHGAVSGGQAATP